MNKKYIEWRGDKRATISEFAEFIGVSQPVMSSWMKRNGKMPGSSSLAKISSKLGLEVYDVLGLPQPAANPLDQLPEELRERLLSAITELNKAYETDGVEPGSPKALALAVKVLGKHGFSVNTNMKANSG